jgi:hypothetical protein
MVVLALIGIIGLFILLVLLLLVLLIFFFFFLVDLFAGKNSLGRTEAQEPWHRPWLGRRR